jgi:hypothetical protein
MPQKRGTLNLKMTTPRETPGRVVASPTCVRSREGEVVSGTAKITDLAGYRETASRSSAGLSATESSATTTETCLDRAQFAWIRRFSSGGGSLLLAG